MMFLLGVFAIRNMNIEVVTVPSIHDELIEICDWSGVIMEATAHNYYSF